MAHTCRPPSKIWFNEEGADGGVDTFVAVCEFVKDVQVGGELMLKRLLDGAFWVASYD